MRYKPEKIFHEVDYEKIPKKELYRIFLEDMENIDIEEFEECYIVGIVHDRDTFKIDDTPLLDFRMTYIYHNDWYIMYYIAYSVNEKDDKVFKAYTNISQEPFLKVIMKENGSKINIPKKQNEIDVSRLTAVIRKLIPIFERKLIPIFEKNI